MLNGIVSCFGCFPRFIGRFQSSSTSTPTAPLPPPSNAQPHQNTSGYQRQESPSSFFHDKAQEIAQIPVSGMLRTPGLGQASSYISSYQPVQSRGPNTAGRGPASADRQGRVENSDTDTNADTLVGSAVDSEKTKEGGYGHDANKSTWQGKPNGTVYDRRTELTEEDEDMWARMAM